MTRWTSTDQPPPDPAAVRASGVLDALARSLAAQRLRERRDAARAAERTGTRG